MAKNMEKALSKIIHDMDRTATEKFESFMRGKNTDYMEGYYAGKSDYIKKACEWFSEHINDYTCYNEMDGWDIRHKEMHEDFRKAMEEEQ